MTLLLTGQQAAELLGSGVTASSLLAQARAGQIPYHLKPGCTRGIRFTQGDIDQILAQSAVPATSPQPVELDEDEMQPTALSEARRTQKRGQRRISA